MSEFRLFVLTMCILYIICLLLLMNLAQQRKKTINCIDQKIPKVIHKILISEKDYVMPTDGKVAHESWYLLNPSYTIKYYTMKDCERYILHHFGNSHLEIFNTIKPFAIKCDFARYCILYNEGGWYSDWNEVCLASLDSFIEPYADFVGFCDVGIFRLKQISHFLLRKNFINIYNGSFGIIPKHDGLYEVIEKCIKHVNENYYGLSCLDPTYGPFSEHILNPKFKNQLGFKYSRLWSACRFLYMAGSIVIQQKHDCEIRQGKGWENDYTEMWQNKDYYA